MESVEEALATAGSLLGKFLSNKKNRKAFEKYQRDVPEFIQFEILGVLASRAMGDQISLAEPGKIVEVTDASFREKAVEIFRESPALAYIQYTQGAPKIVLQALSDILRLVFRGINFIPYVSWATYVALIYGVYLLTQGDTDDLVALVNGSLGVDNKTAIWAITAARTYGTVAGVGQPVYMIQQAIDRGIQTTGEAILPVDEAVDINFVYGAGNSPWYSLSILGGLGDVMVRERFTDAFGETIDLIPDFFQESFDALKNSIATNAPLPEEFNKLNIGIAFAGDLGEKFPAVTKGLREEQRNLQNFKEKLSRGGEQGFLKMAKLMNLQRQLEGNQVTIVAKQSFYKNVVHVVGDTAMNEEDRNQTRYYIVTPRRTFGYDIVDVNLMGADYESLKIAIFSYYSLSSNLPSGIRRYSDITDAQVDLLRDAALTYGWGWTYDNQVVKFTDLGEAVRDFVPNQMNFENFVYATIQPPPSILYRDVDSSDAIIGPTFSVRGNNADKIEVDFRSEFNDMLRNAANSSIPNSVHRGYKYAKLSKHFKCEVKETFATEPDLRKLILSQSAPEHHAFINDALNDKNMGKGVKIFSTKDTTLCTEIYTTYIKNSNIIPDFERDDVSSFYDLVTLDVVPYLRPKWEAFLKKKIGFDKESSQSKAEYIRIGMDEWPKLFQTGSPFYRFLEYLAQYSGHRCISFIIESFFLAPKSSDDLTTKSKWQLRMQHVNFVLAVKGLFGYAFSSVAFKRLFRFISNQDMTLGGLLTQSVLRPLFPDYKDYTKYIQPALVSIVDHWCANATANVLYTILVATGLKKEKTDKITQEGQVVEGIFKIELPQENDLRTGVGLMWDKVTTHAKFGIDHGFLGKNDKSVSGSPVKTNTTMDGIDQLNLFYGSHVKETEFMARGLPQDVWNDYANSQAKQTGTSSADFEARAITENFQENQNGTKRYNGKKYRVSAKVLLEHMKQVGIVNGKGTYKQWQKDYTLSGEIEVKSNETLEIVQSMNGAAPGSTMAWWAENTVKGLLLTAVGLGFSVASTYYTTITDEPTSTLSLNADLSKVFNVQSRTKERVGSSLVFRDMSSV